MYTILDNQILMMQPIGKSTGLTPTEREMIAENFLGRLYWKVALDAAALNFQ